MKLDAEKVGPQRVVILSLLSYLRPHHLTVAIITNVFNISKLSVKEKKKLECHMLMQLFTIFDLAIKVYFGAEIQYQTHFTHLLIISLFSFDMTGVLCSHNAKRLACTMQHFTHKQNKTVKTRLAQHKVSQLVTVLNEYNW